MLAKEASEVEAPDVEVSSSSGVRASPVMVTRRPKWRSDASSVLNWATSSWEAVETWC